MSPETVTAQIDIEQWQRHPGTKLFVKWLDEQIEVQSQLIAKTSGEYEDKTTDKLQRFAMRLATLKMVKTVVKDTQLITQAATI